MARIPIQSHNTERCPTMAHHMRMQHFLRFLKVWNISCFFIGLEPVSILLKSLSIRGLDRKIIVSGRWCDLTSFLWKCQHIITFSVTYKAVGDTTICRSARSARLSSYRARKNRLSVQNGKDLYIRNLKITLFGMNKYWSVLFKWERFIQLRAAHYASIPPPKEGQ